MKKLISTLIAVASLASFSAINAFAEDNKELIDGGHDYDIADMNQDGEYNKLDIRALNIYIGHDTVYTNVYDSDYRLTEAKEEKGVNSDEANEFIAKNGDLNHDGKIDFNDVENLIEFFFAGSLYSLDFNGDGVVNKDDAQYHLDSYAEQQTHQDADSPKPNADMMKNLIENGDYDGDGKADALDTHYLLANILCKIPKGDANTDGAINAVDASLDLRYYSEKQTKKAVENNIDNIVIENAGDFNNDGEVNAVDASLILKHYSDQQTK